MGTAISDDRYFPSPVNHSTLLGLLQLASPTLPVGAYSYSEGLEALVQVGQITDQFSLECWLAQELSCGAVRLEAALMVYSYRATQAKDFAALQEWNQWLSATRETEELRLQSWQMGRSLLRLLQDLQVLEVSDIARLQEEPCNFAIAFGIAAAYWQIDLPSVALGYLHSWATNLVGAGIKLIPLGQTAGQQLLLKLQPTIERTGKQILDLQADDLSSCGWGLSLASMSHETLYSRLFRS